MVQFVACHADEPFDFPDFSIGIVDCRRKFVGFKTDFLDFQLNGVTLLFNAAKTMIVFLMVGRSPTQLAIDLGKTL